jgi:glycerophosphoryl diester phosphodiesterase
MNWPDELVPPRSAAPGGYLSPPRPHAFAHRGGAGVFPENSWRAFEHAAGLGYPYLETDAHATADGVVMAFHDRTLDRVTDRRGRIATLPYATVAAARIAGTDPIPRLDDLLAAWPEVRFNIDLKDDPAVGPVTEVLRRTAAWDRVCLVSFSGRRLAAARQRLPRPVCMATSPAAVGAVQLGPPARLLAGRWARRSVRCAQIPARLVTAATVAHAHAAGLALHVWTVNQRSEMIRLLDLGVDGLMTDQPGLLRAVLTERDQWHPRAL